MNQSLQITVIEDNRSYREVIRLAIERDDEFQISAEFGTAEIALRELSKNKASEQPDLILLDLNLPGMNGLEALPQILEHAPECKILIHSQSDSPQDILKAIALGASGYLLKSSGVKDIRQSIKTTCAGGSIIDPSVAGHLIQLIKQSQPQADPEAPSLSERELNILQLLSSGLAKKEISTELDIAYSTVDTHVRHIYTKLDARNAPSAVSVAHRLGLID